MNAKEESQFTRAREEFQTALESFVRKSYEEIKGREYPPVKSVDLTAKEIRENVRVHFIGGRLTHERGARLPDPEKNRPWAKWDDLTVWEQIDLWFIEKYLTALEKRDEL